MPRILTSTECEEIASRYRQHRDVLDLVATVEELADLLTESFDYAQHAPGCSGAITEPGRPGAWVYSCKCGFRAWLPQVREILGLEESNDDTEQD